ncbi:MAG: aspartate/glutamate racemase family protein [Bilophila wadsworthia]
MQRKLVERGITVLIPEEDGRVRQSRHLRWLCLGTVSESSRRAFAAIIGGLTARGAQGVILGCTEIGLLVRPGDTSARLFDTTEIHARRAALYALGEAVPRDGGE